MPAVSLHGATVKWSLAGGVRDPLAELLAVFGPSSDAAAGAGVVFEFRSAAASAAADPRGEGWEPSFFHGAVEAFRGPGGFLIWDHATRVFVPLGGGAIQAEIAPLEREVTVGSTSTAMQLALILALRPLGFFHLHAAAVVLPSGTPVLVVGGTGAGKTTTTLGLLEGESSLYLGDDSLYVTASADAGALDLVVAFPRAFHLGPTTLSAFPRLTPLAGPPPAHTDKRSVDPSRAYPGRFRPTITLPRSPRRALALFPSVAGTPLTSVTPLDRAEAFGRLLASSGAIVVDGVPGRDANLAALRALLDAVECYEIGLGDDVVTEPERAIGRRVRGLG